jgi:hypothetical protein
VLVAQTRREDIQQSANWQPELIMDHHKLAILITWTIEFDDMQMGYQK